jgi:flavin-dependent dehydrogenase
MYDVAVIGAGLAGLQCARLLAARGLRVLLADRKRSLSAPVHTTGIFVRKTWEDFPLPHEQLGPGIRRVRLYSPRRRSIDFLAPHDEFRVGRMDWIYLFLLEQCHRLGVDWMPEATLTAVDGEEIAFGRRRVHARFVVGADGARSTVARLFGLDRNTEYLVGLEEIVASEGGEPALHCYLDPVLAPGYIAWNVDDGHERHIGVAGYRDRFEPAAALHRFRAETGGGRAVERRGGLIPIGGILRRIARPGALLIGDAAGAVSPLTAGGLDGAMRLSTYAAGVIATHLQSGDPAVLRDYSGDRFRARFLARRWMRNLMRAVESPVAMELAFAALRLPPLGALASAIFFARRSFPDVPWSLVEGHGRGLAGVYDRALCVEGALIAVDQFDGVAARRNVVEEAGRQ